MGIVGRVGVKVQITEKEHDVFCSVRVFILFIGFVTVQDPFIESIGTL